MLIQLREGLIVNTDKIKEVDRCGNYTDVRFMDGRLEQIWDEDKVIWERIVLTTKIKL